MTAAINTEADACHKSSQISTEDSQAFGTKEDTLSGSYPWAVEFLYVCSLWWYTVVQCYHVLIYFSILNVNKHEEHYDRHQALTKYLWALRFAYITVKATHILKLSQPKSSEKIHVKTQQHCFCWFLYTVILMDIVIPHKLFTIPRKKRKGKIIDSLKV